MNATARSVLRIIVSSIGCLMGLSIIAYGVYLWRGYGFDFGPPHRFSPGAPDPSAGARYFVILGSVVAVYFGFLLNSAIVFARGSRDDGDEEVDQHLTNR